MTTPMSDEAKKTAMLERVRAILAKAESERELGHEEYADECTAIAMRLMAKYGIDEALAKARANVKATPTNRVFVIDEPYAGTKVLLLNAVAKALHCDGIQLSTSGPKTRYHMFGFESDIQMADMLYTSLSLQMAGAVATYRIPSWLRGRQVMAEKRSVMLGFISAVRPRLEAAYKLAETEADDTGTKGTALVLASREVAVKAALRDKYSSIRRTTTTTTGRGVGHGRAAGQQANIHDRGEVRNRQAALSR